MAIWKDGHNILGEKESGKEEGMENKEEGVSYVSSAIKSFNDYLEEETENEEEGVSHVSSIMESLNNNLEEKQESGEEEETENEEEGVSAAIAPQSKGKEKMRKEEKSDVDDDDFEEKDNFEEEESEEENNFEEESEEEELQNDKLKNRVIDMGKSLHILLENLHKIPASPPTSNLQISPEKYRKIVTNYLLKDEYSIQTSQKSSLNFILDDNNQSTKFPNCS